MMNQGLSLCGCICFAATVLLVCSFAGEDHITFASATCSSMASATDGIKKKGQRISMVGRANVAGVKIAGADRDDIPSRYKDLQRIRSVLQ